MSYWRLFYHFVWGTKHREPLIARSYRHSVYNAIAAKAIDLGGIAHAVGGIEDHIHLVASVPPKMAISTFIGQMKGSSSHFVNHEIRPEGKFNWQAEYGVISFGERHLPWVVQYAHNQSERHSTGSAVARLEQTSDE